MVNKTALRMISRFRDLLELAKTEFVCDEEFDKEMFCDLIKNCYEYFLKERDADKAFDTDKIELYSQLEEILMLLDIGVADKTTTPLPNHNSRKALTETVSFI